MATGVETERETIATAIERRRRDVARQWQGSDAVVLIGAGHEIPIPGRGDRIYPFLSHSEYFYLTDRQRPGAVLAFDPAEGWTDFVPEVTADERLWTGPIGDDSGTSFSAFDAWLARRHGRTIIQLGAAVPGIDAEPTAAADTRAALDRVRRIKDAVEVARMRVAANATRTGFVAAVATIAPGVTERALQIEIEAAFFRNGADAVAYDSIVASGSSAAVLHHPPTRRVLAAGELVLVDAGAEYRAYDCDVTRTYAVSGRMTPEQADIYALVLRVERASIERCVAGAEYREIHLKAAHEIAQGLADLGFLRGSAADLVESGASALFFPHGIGHMVGLGVRDAGGYAPGRARSSAPALRFLRVDLPLEPGFVMTIEPGIYFPEHVLSDPDVRQRHRDHVAWDRVDRLQGFGGIRIEDNVLVLDRGNEVLTQAIPK